MNEYWKSTENYPEKYAAAPPKEAGKIVSATYFNGMILIACENGLYALAHDESNFNKLYFEMAEPVDKPRTGS